METTNETTTPVSTPTISEPSVAPVASGLKKKMLLVVAFCITVFLVTVVINFLYNTSLKKPRTPTYDKEVLRESNNEIQKFLENTSAKNQEEFKQFIDKKLADTEINKETRDSLLLQKAAILAVVRGSLSTEEYHKQSSSIFLNFITATSTKSSKAKLNRDFAIVALAHQTKQCCELIKDFNSPYLNAIEAKHLKPGYPVELSDFLTINELLGDTSPISHDDIFKISLKLAIEAEIINFYDTLLDEKTSASIKKDIGELIELYPYSVPRTFRDKVTTQIETKLYYAYGYDIYNSKVLKEKLTAEKNKEIDANYKDVFTILEKEISTSNDKTSLSLMWMYNAGRYLHSVERRYGKVVAKPEISRILATGLTMVNGSPEIKRVCDNYFKLSLNGSHQTIGSFVRLAKEYPSARAYMESIGIKVDDLAKTKLLLIVK